MANDDWNDLGAVWQEKSDDVDIAALTKNIHRKAVFTQLCFMAEAAICMFGVGVGFHWLMGSDGDLARAGLGLLFCLFSAAGLYLSWWSRKGAWRIMSDSPLDELKFARARAQAGIRYAQMNLWFLPPGFLVMVYALWFVWQSTADDPSYEGSLVGIAVIIPIFLIGTGVWAVWYKRKKRKEIKALDQVISEMEEE